MKKLFIILFATMMAELFGWDGGYYIPCYRCKECTKEYNYVCPGCNAHRSYEEEGDKGKYAGYMVYRCNHGHVLLIPKTSENKSRELNEILIEDRNGKREPLKNK